MKITSNMLDEKISKYEHCPNDFMTYAEHIRFSEGMFGIVPADIRNMNDEELDKYDTFLFEFSLK